MTFEGSTMDRISGVRVETSHFVELSNREPSRRDGRKISVIRLAPSAKTRPMIAAFFSEVFSLPGYIDEEAGTKTVPGAVCGSRHAIRDPDG